MNIAFGFVYDNVSGNVYDVVEIFVVVFIGIGIASSCMFGNSEINRNVQIGNVGAAYTVGRILPFAFDVLVYMFLAKIPIHSGPREPAEKGPAAHTTMSPSILGCVLIPPPMNVSSSSPVSRSLLLMDHL